LDRCFKLIGEKPVAPSGRLHETFVEDFRRELAEIQNPAAKALFVLIKANHLIHFRMAEYGVLIAMADVTGHFGVGVLLESCLADKVAFLERTRRLIRNTIETKHGIKLAA
jgi:ferritin-like metal-binding protein YciE